jgi:RimJ/RimL family protein N-acetyltransferase
MPGFPVSLAGEQVRLREIDIATDLDPVAAFMGDPAVTHYMMLEPQSRDEEVVALTMMMERARLPERAHWDLVVECAATGEVVGMGGIRFTGSNRGVADIGYVVRPASWERGYGSEIAALLVDFGFTTLGVHRIWATVHPENGASQRVLERVGMTREGRLREHEFVHGAWRDSFVYAVLDREWDGGR